MISIKSLITLTIISITCSSAYAVNENNALCESELLGANQKINSSEKLGLLEKNNLKKCLPNFAACTNYDLKYNCQHIYNAITAVQPAHAEKTPLSPSTKITAPALQHPTTTNTITEPQQKTNTETHPPHNGNNQSIQNPPKQPQINWQ